MLQLQDPIQQLISVLARLPGIGEKTAARLVFYLLRQAQHKQVSVGHDLIQALQQALENTRLCQECQSFSAQDKCSICTDPKRDRSTICVLEGVAELRVLSAAASYRGLFHVLHGTLSPLDGVGPSDLKIQELLTRLRTQACQEVILANSTTVDGDATALYLMRLLRPLGIKMTRLASGVPMGGELEYLDPATLSRALTERREV